MSAQEKYPVRRRGGSLISKIHQISGRIFNRLLVREGIGEINSAQGRILFALWEMDGIPITELSGMTLLERSTLTGMLDRLERDGLVMRKPSPEDRRAILIFRTEKDRKFQKKYIAVSEVMLEIFYKGLSETEIDRFEKTLDTVLKNCIGADDVYS